MRRLVEMHGGRVAARSDGPGRGSELIIWLPLASIPERQLAAASGPGTDAAAGRGGRG